MEEIVWPIKVPGGEKNSLLRIHKEIKIIFFLIFPI